MSLGFNHNRKPRQSTLPGVINPLVLPNRPRATTTPNVVRRRSPPATMPKVQQQLPLPIPAPAPVEEMHHVFASVAIDLVDATDPTTIVARQGERIVLVYPMSTDSEDGRVKMKMKRVDTNNAQLSYATVTVYDPNSEIRYVNNFSLFP